MINGKKIFLAPFTKNHLKNPCYLLWLKNKTITKYIGRPELNKNITIKTLKKYFVENSKSKQCKMFGIHEKKTKVFIGTAKIKFLKIAGKYDNVADLGLMIGDKSFWGKRFGTDVLQTLSCYAFKKMKARKLTGGVMSPNIGMIKAFKNAGFKIEGKLQKQIRLKNIFVDHILFGLLKAKK